MASMRKRQSWNTSTDKEGHKLRILWTNFNSLFISSQAPKSIVSKAFSGISLSLPSLVYLTSFSLLISEDSVFHWTFSFTHIISKSMSLLVSCSYTYNIMFSKLCFTKFCQSFLTFLLRSFVNDVQRRYLSL